MCLCCFCAVSVIAAGGHYQYYVQQMIRSDGQDVIVMNESTRNHNCRNRKMCTRPRANDDSHASHRGPDCHRAIVSRQVTSTSPRKSQLREVRYLILSCANKTGDVKEGNRTCNTRRLNMCPTKRTANIQNWILTMHVALLEGACEIGSASARAAV